MPRVASLRPDRTGLAETTGFFDPEQVDDLGLEQPDDFQPERPDDLSRNEWTLSSGMGGRFHRNTQEYPIAINTPL